MYMASRILLVDLLTLFPVAADKVEPVAFTVFLIVFESHQPEFLSILNA
jgi:hypothetical protein